MDAGQYEAITGSIRVSVEPSYVEEQSSTEDGYYFWTYTVEILNLGEEPVQLRSRYWRITDANGQIREVHGMGVIGEEPVIGPGEAYQYTSGTPLPTPSGIMQGWYQMERESGELFNVAIPAFSLDSPHFDRILN